MRGVYCVIASCSGFSRNRVHALGRNIGDGLQAEKKKGVLWKKRDEQKRVRPGLDRIECGNVKKKILGSYVELTERI